MQSSRYLLVGGSNSILKDGYGTMLQLQLPGDWCNQSLGNSSSLRGVEYLLNHQASLDQIDQIFFEYTLNDLIFETSNTLDPITHLDWLQCLVSVDKIREKLIFVLLHGQGASTRINSGHSFVVDNYRKIISQFGVRSIDLFPLIGETVETRGQAAVFKDNDHFTPHMVQALASQTIVEWTRFSVQPPLQFQESPKVNKGLVTINPLVDAHIHNATPHEFRTALLAAPLVKMTEASEIHFKSPGGALVGFYAIASHEAACVRITYQQREVVKAIRLRVGMAKPYLALRHLTTPIYTLPGEDIIVRYAPDIYSVPNATLDNTHAHVINDIGSSAVDVGNFIFLAEQMNITTNSTLKSTTPVALTSNEGAVVGKYLSYPDLTGNRIAQGGLRTSGKFKHSLPDMPLVTIITVCLNSEKTLEQCIQSVLHQTYENIEYIIIDGGSSDGTLELIKKYKESVDYFVSEPDRGLYHAMNKGLELATGDYILVLNSDDWYSNDCVECLVKDKYTSGASFVSALAQNVDHNDKPLNIIRSMPFDECLRFRMPLRHETMLLSADIYNNIGYYDERYRIIADFHLTLRIFEKGYSHHEVPRPLMYFKNTGVSSTDITKLTNERRRFLADQFPFMEAGDISILAERGKLTPANFMLFMDRYSKQQTLIQALRSYIVDLQSAGAVHWKGVDIPLICGDMGSMPPSTIKNTTPVTLTSDEGAVVGKYPSYPDLTGNRIAQGGLRTSGKFKHSLPDMPLVTIITVCLNSEKTLEQCIQSVLQQTYENIEYIIIDGGSSDGTLELLKKYKESVDYFVSEPDRGLYHAMNKGLELASGDYILILNSDDWYETDCVARLLRGLQASGMDFSSALARRVDVNGKETDILQSMPYDDSLRFGMSLRHELMLVPANIYNSIGNYNTDYRIVSDFDFTIRLFNADYTVYEIQAPLLNFRLTGVSNTNWDTLINEHFKLLRSQFGNVREDTLLELSDPRKYTAEVVDRALLSNVSDTKFVDSLIAYGYRRKLYNPFRQPALRRDAAPMVSVIVPAYKAVDTIDRCLSSILDQSLRELEIICVDDASPDDTALRIGAIMDCDSRVSLINNKKNCGVAASRNAALKQARGRYVFFVDADDELLPDALARLVAMAEKQHCDLVKGAYETIRDKEKPHITGLPPNNGVVETTLRKTPELLKRGTEGFWTYLYRRSFIRNAKFSENIRMGEDSLFLIAALVRTQNIAWIPDAVYRYHINNDSAMSNFDLHKYLNSIEWRERAWQIFHDHGFEELANWCAFDYWNPVYFNDMSKRLDSEQVQHVQDRLKVMLKNTGYKPGISRSGDISSKIFDPLYNSFKDEKVASSPKESKKRLVPDAPVYIGDKTDIISRLRIGVFSTMDKGGAATGSVRRVELLRAEGVNVTLHTLVSSKNRDYLRQLISKDSQDEMWQKLKKLAIDPVMKDPGYRGSELFSMPRSVLDYTQYKNRFSTLDIIHLHWVVGIFDYQNCGSVIGNKGVVWTLADMSAFTGGCHYSEGCNEFENQCRNCHLLPSGSTLAHDNWKIKRRAYDNIKNIEIICPSEWIAERVSRSSLLGDRKINVIPNALPVNSFMPVNQLVARIKLGLPLHKKLILFGAESLANKRKGGDILKEALTCLASIADIRDVEVMTYGHHTLDLPLPVHSLGFLNDHEQLSLAYSAANVYAFPSREDNAPLTVAESLMCGTPVVAFPVGNLPELVTHEKTGYLAEYLSAQDFCKGLEWGIRALDDAERIDVIQKCRQAAIRHHDPKLAINRHLQVYLRVHEKSGHFNR